MFSSSQSLIEKNIKSAHDTVFSTERAIEKRIKDFCFYLIFASRQFGADARRAGCRCISILPTPRNKADAPKLRDRLFRQTSAFLQDAFISRWVKRKSGEKEVCTPLLLKNNHSNADVRAKLRFYAILR